MRIWVTRPQQDAGVLRARLIAQGHEVILEPLLEIRFDRDEPLDLDDAQALIATSKNGIRALVDRIERGELDRELCSLLRIYAVGPGTASTARAAGFHNVVKGPSSARQLTAIIAETAQINDGSLVHLSGAEVAYNLSEELRRLGYHVLQPILYHAHQAQRLSDRLLTRLTMGRIEGVLLLSPRTAEAYVRLIQAHQILRSAQKLTHYCLSDAVASQLALLQLEKVEVSRAPNIEEMLALTAVSAAK